MDMRSEKYPYRFASQFGIKHHFNRCVERVHITMQYRTVSTHCHSPRFLCFKHIISLCDMSIVHLYRFIQFFLDTALSDLYNISINTEGGTDHEKG